jgi:hypothetical protein
LRARWRSFALARPSPRRAPTAHIHPLTVPPNRGIPLRCKSGVNRPLTPPPPLIYT